LTLLISSAANLDTRNQRVQIWVKRFQFVEPDNPVKLEKSEMDWKPSETEKLRNVWRHTPTHTQTGRLTGATQIPKKKRAKSFPGLIWLCDYICLFFLLLKDTCSPYSCRSLDCIKMYEYF
jgi:hypothetical protein